MVSGIAAIRTVQRPAVGAASRRWPRHEAVATAGALLALVLVGVLLTGGFYAAFRSSLERRTREGASILAREGLRSWSAIVTAAELGRLPVGGDSTVANADVAAGDSFVGGYAVRVARTGAATVQVISTGVLAGRGYPITCTITVNWEVDSPSTRRALDGAGAPECARAGETRAVAVQLRESS